MAFVGRDDDVEKNQKAVVMARRVSEARGRVACTKSRLRNSVI